MKSIIPFFIALIAAIIMASPKNAHAAEPINDVKTSKRF